MSRFSFTPYHAAFSDPDMNDRQIAGVEMFAPDLAAGLGVLVEDAAAWLYEGELLTGAETVEGLVRQWHDEHREVSHG